MGQKVVQVLSITISCHIMNELSLAVSPWNMLYNELSCIPLACYMVSDYFTAYRPYSQFFWEVHVQMCSWVSDLFTDAQDI